MQLIGLIEFVPNCRVNLHYSIILGTRFFFVFQSMGTFFTRKLFFTTLTKFVRLEDFFPKNNLTIERGKT